MKENTLNNIALRLRRVMGGADVAVSMDGSTWTEAHRITVTTITPETVLPGLGKQCHTFGSMREFETWLREVR